MGIKIKGEDTSPLPLLKTHVASAKPKSVRKPAAEKEAAREVRRDAAGVSPKRIILTMPEDLTKRLDAEWHRRLLTSRAETIRALLDEALKP